MIRDSQPECLIITLAWTISVYDADADLLEDITKIFTNFE